MACYHSINGLKGASIKTTDKSIISFPQTEINLVHNSLKIIQFYITRNPQIFQQPEEVLRKVTKAIDIISEKNPSPQQSLKSASSNNICPNTKREHLKELLNMFRL